MQTRMKLVRAQAPDEGIIVRMGCAKMLIVIFLFAGGPRTNN